MSKHTFATRTQSTFLVLFLFLAAIAVLSATSAIHVTSPLTIAVIWIVVVPLSYQVLSEHASAPRLSLQLPGIPTGSSWQPNRARPKTRPPLQWGERALRDLKTGLQRLGYSQSPSNGTPVDLVADSPEGKRLVIKVVDGQAGVLACQDAMKAMLSNGSREAILLAQEGSTSTARRFVRRLRSRRGLRIRIWHSVDSVEEQMDR